MHKNPFRYFHDEAELFDYVREYSSTIFGEEIQWDDRKQIYGETGNPITPDLIGYDTDGNTIIVEVKMLRNDDTRYDRAREAIGQVLHYLHASIAQFDGADPDPKDYQLVKYSTRHRLYIVGAHPSPAVENMCKLLRAHGVNIEYRCVN